MKTKIIAVTPFKRAALLLLLSTLFAQTTAFTYQARLTDNGSPANGI